MRNVSKSQDPTQGKLPGDFTHDHSAELQRQRGSELVMLLAVPKAPGRRSPTASKG